MYWTIVLLILSVTKALNSEIEKFYTNCQDASYGCFVNGSPDCEKSKNCSFGATWKGVAEDEYQFQTIASSSTPDKYVAIGFPAVSGMSPAPVIGCSSQFKEAAIYFNKDTNSLPAFNHSDFITSYTVVAEDNITSCEFFMNSNFKVAQDNKTGETEYDLNTNSTYIIMAVGPVKDGVMKYHDDKNKSASLVDLKEHNGFLKPRPGNLFYYNCQDSKNYGCFTSPDGCLQSQSCVFGATWKGLSETEYQFQTISFSYSADHYVAIGFPAVSGMSPAPVIGCSSQFKEAVIYFNKDTNSLPAFNHSDFVSSYTVIEEDSITSCDFVMKSNFKVSPDNKTGETEYDLNINTTFIIMAVGPVKDGVMQFHDDKKKSASLIDLTDHNNFYNPSTVDQFYSNCQDSKVYGCFTSPDNCVESKNCSFGATWKGISETEYEFQTMASSSTPEKYVAIGFPAVQGMSPAPVIGCSSQFKEAAIYFNSEQMNSLPAFNHSDWASSYIVVTEDGMTSCDFVLKSNFTVAENNKTGEIEYDLNTNTTYVIMAVGSVKDGVMQYHDDKNKSASLIDLTDHNEFYEKNGTNHTGGPIYDNCYEDKGCFGIPYNCEKQRNCDIIITYTKVKQAREDKEHYKFEIGGKISQGYTAVGLSLDNQMGSDSVMACVQDPTNHSLSVQMYWNTASPYNSLRLDQPQLGLSDISLASEDGMYTCTFYREAVTNITIPGGGNNTATFDLDNTKYYLLLASGPVDSGDDKIQKHTVTGKTGESVDLGDFSQVSGDKGTLVKLHASFMVLAWLLFANLGTFTARYCKDIFTGRQIMSVAVWFQVHRVSMILCVLLSVAGLVPIIIDKGLQPIKAQKLHPLLGLTVLVVAFIQPIIAYFRPGKDARFRPLFKFVHTALGYTAIILAIASIFLTNELETKYLPDWGTYLMYAFTGWLALSHLAMTGYFCVKEGEVQTGFDDNPLVRTGLNVFVVGILGLSAAVIMSVVLK